MPMTVAWTAVPRCRSAGRQRGLSLVELMVGIAVGMFVVAAAATLVSTQLADNRRLLLATQMQQDLRAAADIIARDLRRAGTFEGVPVEAANYVWRPGDATAAIANSSLPASPATHNTTTSEVIYRSGRTRGNNGPYGFKLEPGSNFIESLYVGGSDGVWQPLTDPATMKVTRFAVTAKNEPPVQLVCAKLCADPLDLRGCWPTVTVRSFRVEIDAESVGTVGSDTVTRKVDEIVNLRTVATEYEDPTGYPRRACPQ